MRVLVFGCGPAGLIATHSAVLSGHDVTVLSRKEKSFIGGAQYLHEPIPEITKPDPDGIIQVEMWGSEGGYAEKVYGDKMAETSWRDFAPGGLVLAWDLRKTYDTLWRMYEGKVVNMDLTSDRIRDSVNGADLVISSIPAKSLCIRRDIHQFQKQKVLISHRAGRLDGDGNTIIYNGDPEYPWYRWSTIFGVQGGYEYPVGEIVADAKVISKPLKTNCTCWKQIVRVGRYGRWEKRALTHHAFGLTQQALESVS